MSSILVDVGRLHNVNCGDSGNEKEEVGEEQQGKRMHMCICLCVCMYRAIYHVRPSGVFQTVTSLLRTIWPL